ncbi:MAG: DUF1232 domain-containing protein [Spirulina sp. SIO3F2]|nr:DUF1232 domain-containing protein [Spirulina sp. SIO3F2]
MPKEPTYSDERFWRKLGRFARKAGKQVVEKALILYYAAQSPQTPAWAKTTIYGALAYFILPIDLIPDFIPVAGYTDDLTTLAAAIAVVAVAITPEVKAQARQKLNDWFGEAAALTLEESEARSSDSPQGQ